MDSMKFIQELMKLKLIKRTGWVRKNVRDPESVADHTYGVIQLALFAPLPEDVDRDKLVKMAIIHDAAEVRIGDVVWEKGNFSDKQKQQMKHEEETAFMHELPDELCELGLAFVEQSTPEARYLKELDKIDMVMTALEYEKYVHPEVLNEFWENADMYIKTDLMKQWMTRLRKQRQR